MNRNYYRVMLGRASVYAPLGFEGGFIGADYEIAEDLSPRLSEDWRAFNKELIPVFLANHPQKTKIAAGLACGALWTVSIGIRKGDIVLCPAGSGTYRVGEVQGDYYYVAGAPLPHRRPVTWREPLIERAAMSDSLKASTTSWLTVCDISGYRSELEGLIEGRAAPTQIATDQSVEDPVAFAMERHLEDFLVQNWAHTELGKQYDILEEDGERVGQQYPTDTGPVDILAISKDKKELLVVELKKGRASDAVVGQVLRYMGYVRQELAEKEQNVRGVIVATDDDPRLRRALVMTPAVDFYRYQISFKLLKG